MTIYLLWSILEHKNGTIRHSYYIETNGGRKQSKMYFAPYDFTIIYIFNILQMDLLEVANAFRAELESSYLDFEIEECLEIVCAQ